MGTTTSVKLRLVSGGKSKKELDERELSLWDQMLDDLFVDYETVYKEVNQLIGEHMTEGTGTQKPESVKAIFSGEIKSRSSQLTPDQRAAIQQAFIALEDLLVSAFPAGRRLDQILTFLEMAALYVLRIT